MIDILQLISTCVIAFFGIFGALKDFGQQKLFGFQLRFLILILAIIAGIASISTTIYSQHQTRKKFKWANTPLSAWRLDLTYHILIDKNSPLYSYLDNLKKDFHPSTHGLEYLNSYFTDDSGSMYFYPQALLDDALIIKHSETNKTKIIREALNVICKLKLGIQVVGRDKQKGRFRFSLNTPHSIDICNKWPDNKLKFHHGDIIVQIENMEFSQYLNSLSVADNKMSPSILDLNGKALAVIMDNKIHGIFFSKLKLHSEISNVEFYENNKNDINKRVASKSLEITMPCNESIPTSRSAFDCDDWKGMLKHLEIGL